MQQYRGLGDGLRGIQGTGEQDDLQTKLGLCHGTLHNDIFRCERLRKVMKT